MFVIEDNLRDFSKRNSEQKMLNTKKDNMNVALVIEEYERLFLGKFIEY